jgi:hypothetical protein
MAELIDLLEGAFSGNEEESKGINQEGPIQEAPKLVPEEELKEEADIAPVPASKVKRVAAPKGPKKQPTLDQKFKKQPTTAEEWFLARNQFPAEFTYTAEGDLQVPPIKPGDVARVIPLPRFQRATPEFTAEFYKTRAEQAKEQEEMYVKSKRILNSVVLLYKNGDATVDEVLNANTQVAIEERKLNEILKLPRIRDDASKVAESSLTMNLYDKGKVTDPVLYTTYTTFPARSLWMPAPEPEVVALQPLPIRQTEGNTFNSNSNNTPPPPKKSLTAQQIAIIRAKMGKK